MVSQLVFCTVTLPLLGALDVEVTPLITESNERACLNHIVYSACAANLISLLPSGKKFWSRSITA